MKKILVTGANGQLGLQIKKQYEGKDDIELYLTDIDKLDISDINQVMGLVSEIKPYAIINCAAYNAVDNCELDRESGFKINSIGPRNLAIAADRYDCKLVHISTDYVFDGNNTIPYTEYDNPNPLSQYGKSKLAGEQYVKEFCKKHFIIRTAWLYGKGKNFIETMLKLSENHKELRVVSDQYGTPTSVVVLGEIIDKLIFTDNYGLYHGTCEGQCSWADFAEEIFRLSGKDTKVVRVTTEEYGAKANRPHYSVLENLGLKLVLGYVAPSWRVPLKKYIEDRSEIC